MKLQRSTVLRSPHQFLRGYKYTPGLDPSGRTWCVQSQALQFWHFSKQAELTWQKLTRMHGGILVTEVLGKRGKFIWTWSLNDGSFTSMWLSRLPPFSHCGGTNYTPLSLCLMFFCRDRVNRMPTSRAYLTQQERKTNAWQPHLLLPLRVPCSLVCAVPYTHVLTT